LTSQHVPALAVSGLVKRFGARAAVDDLTLSVAPGSFYALLGPNGAGKTTTLRIVAGLTTADAGSVAVFGVDTARDAVAAKAITAWVPDDPLVYDKLTPTEYLGFVAGLWRVPTATARRNAAALIERLGLAPHAHERCESFSKGMRQKVALAGALVHDPRLIILDEPLTGLDAASAKIVKDVLLDRVRGGASVVMTTHILEVAERMAERIGVIDRGRLVAEGTLDDLRRQAGGAGGTLEDVFLALTGGTTPSVDTGSVTGDGTRDGAGRSAGGTVGGAAGAGRRAAAE
jgi:ABC-2 type transport system ATP-binding protein